MQGRVPRAADYCGDYVSLFMLYTADIVNLAKLFIPNAKSFAIFCANSRADSSTSMYVCPDPGNLHKARCMRAVHVGPEEGGVKAHFFSHLCL